MNVAGTDLSDRVNEVALALFDMARTTGWARNRTGWAGTGIGNLARYSGQTEEQVTGQLDGSLEPTAGQAVALLRALRLAGSNGNGAAA